MTLIGSPSPNGEVAASTAVAPSTPARRRRRAAWKPAPRADSQGPPPQATPPTGNDGPDASVQWPPLVNARSVRPWTHLPGSGVKKAGAGACAPAPSGYQEDLSENYSYRAFRVPQVVDSVATRAIEAGEPDDVVVATVAAGDRRRPSGQPRTTRWSSAAPPMVMKASVHGPAVACWATVTPPAQVPASSKM